MYYTFTSISVAGMILIPGNLSGNALLNNDGTHSLSPSCRYKFSAIVRKKVLNTLATIPGSFTFSLFIRRDEDYSSKCILSVSFFIMFHVVFILLSDFAICPSK
jgi:hypothetical protein